MDGQTIKRICFTSLWFRSKRQRIYRPNAYQFPGLPIEVALPITQQNLRIPFANRTCFSDASYVKAIVKFTHRTAIKFINRTRCCTFPNKQIQMEISLRNGLLKYDEKNSNSQLGCCFATVLRSPGYGVELLSRNMLHCFTRAAAARRKSWTRKFSNLNILDFTRFEHFTLIKL